MTVGELLQPPHVLVLLVLIAIFAGFRLLNKFREIEHTVFKRPAMRPPKSNSNSDVFAQREGMHRRRDECKTEGSKFKFCSECGKQILRRAEMCPLCGCLLSLPPS